MQQFLNYLGGQSNIQTDPNALALPSRNEHIRGALQADRFGQKFRQAILRWFGLGKLRDDDYVCRKVLEMRSCQEKESGETIGGCGEGGHAGGRSEGRWSICRSKGRWSIWPKCIENPLWRSLIGKQEEEDCPYLNPGVPRSDCLLLPQPLPSFPSFCSSFPVVAPSVSASPARDGSCLWRHLVQHSNVLKDIETRSPNWICLVTYRQGEWHFTFHGGMRRNVAERVMNWTVSLLQVSFD